MAIRSLKTGTFSRSTQVGNSIILPGDFESIATSTPSGTGTVTFSSIPSTFTHLQIRGIFSASVASRNIVIQFNSDTGTNYSWHELSCTGTTVGASSGINSTVMYVASAANTTSSLNPCAFIIDILDYANTNKYKTLRSFNGADINGSGGVFLDSGFWRSTSAITSVTVNLNSGNYQTGSNIALYGIRG